MEEFLIKKINKLKKERNAVILVHNYQLPEVQDIADYVGDSLGLSIQAAKTEASVIVFCGVHFMAETAAIISPKKKVIMPEASAGCPMADMINVEQLRKLKSKHPEAKVVCYVNSTAAIKAESDICCTSANATKVVQSFTEANEIIFVPDKYLGHYTQTQVPDKKLYFSNGYCPTHVKILPEHIKAVKVLYPKAKVLVHPECRPETIALADATLSTGGMLKYVKAMSDQEFIIATEVGIIHSLKKQSPEKQFYPALPQAICPNMKLTTLEKVLWALQDMATEVKVLTDIAKKAKIAIKRMLAVGRQQK